MALNGRIEKTDIPTLLRAVEKDKNSGELSFNRSGDRIDLYFLFGQLYHAKWLNVTGVDAVMEVLGWKNGNYTFTEGVIPAQASINDDIERILGNATPVVATTEMKIAERRNTTSPLIGTPPTPAYSINSMPTPNPAGDAGGDLSDLIPFDLAALDSMNAVFPTETPTPTPSQSQAAQQRSMQMSQPQISQSQRNPSPMGYSPTDRTPPPPAQAAESDPRIAPAPPSGGLYRTRLFCLPTGEQMATALVATAPQLEEELLHLADIKFTGYVLGGPDLNGFASVGICILRGRFIHAFHHSSGPNGLSLVEGERAYRTVLDPSTGRSSRFYWFYELPAETMRAAIALLTPPTRYAHLEVRIIRFKELLRLLNEESYTGTLRITIPPGALGPDRQPSSLAGERAYIPVYQGNILGLWSENHPRLTNDGQLLQRYLNEPQAFLDLHVTAQVADPGMPLEMLVSPGTQSSQVGTLPDDTSSQATVAYAAIARNLPASGAGSEPSIPIQAVPMPTALDSPSAIVDDDERQLLLITSIGRMESTWTQMQKKERMEDKTSLLALAGFANEALSMSDTVNGPRGVQEMVNRALRNELAQYRTIFQLLDLNQGKINISKLLREHELFSRDGEQSAADFTREASRGLRTLLRSTFQHYVSTIRSEQTRLESQDMYEVFLQEVVRKM